MVRVMGIFGGSPSPRYVPMPAAPPEPPTPVDQAAQDAAMRTKSELAAASGYGSTTRTSSQGVLDEPKLQRKTLLGS
jgi:hypothetical protein